MRPDTLTGLKWLKSAQTALKSSSRTGPDMDRTSSVLLTKLRTSPNGAVSLTSHTPSDTGSLRTSLRITPRTNQRTWLPSSAVRQASRSSVLPRTRRHLEMDAPGVTYGANRSPGGLLLSRFATAGVKSKLVSLLVSFSRCLLLLAVQYVVSNGVRCLALTLLCLSLVCSRAC